MSKLTIAIDPKYNFHTGYHPGLMSALEEEVIWVHGKVINTNEALLSPQEVSDRVEYVSIGTMEVNQSVNYLLTDHVLLESITPYIMALEDIYWLFGDTYSEVYSKKYITRMKVDLVIHMMSESNLAGIIWYSKTASNRFKKFCSDNNISEKITKIIVAKSVIIYPVLDAYMPPVKKVSKGRFITASLQKDYERKGIDLLIGLFNKSGYELTIITDVSQKDSGNIKYIAWMDKVTLESTLQNYQSYLFFSRQDTWGMVILDAFRAKIPVVALNSPNNLVLREINKLSKNIHLIKMESIRIKTFLDKISNIKWIEEEISPSFSIENCRLNFNKLIRKDSQK